MMFLHTGVLLHYIGGIVDLIIYFVSLTGNNYVTSSNFGWRISHITAKSQGSKAHAPNQSDPQQSKSYRGTSMMCRSAPDWPRLFGIPLSGGQLFDGLQ